MSRLTNTIREQMARKLVAFRYTDEAKALVQLNRALADRAYAHLYTKDVTDAMEVIGKAFSGAFERTTYGFFVNAGGYSVELGCELHSHWIQFEQAKPEGYLVVSRYSKNHNLTDEKLIEEAKDFADRYRRFGAACQTAYNEAMAVLNTCSTGKKLAEAWPEAMEVIGDLIPEGERTLPVVQVADVNKKFGLPPKSKKAAA
jgi:hypothetical protein